MATAAVDRRPSRRRHRHRQRRRAGAGELLHLRPASDDRIRRFGSPTVDGRPRRASRLRRARASPLRAHEGQPDDRTGRDRRSDVRRHRRARCGAGARGRHAVRRDVHDLGLARHRRLGHGEPLLRHACRVRTRGGGGPAHRVPGHRRPRSAAADRRARPGARAPHVVRRSSARRVPRVGRARRRRHQLRARGHRSGRGATARLLGQLRRPAHPRRRPVRHPALALPGQRRRAGDLDGERPPRPRVPVLRTGSAARRHDADRGRDRHDEQLRRAPRGRRRSADPSRRKRSAIRRRVIAGTDCGFDTSAGIGDVAPSVVWEKLRALRAGADLASARLF